MPSSSSYQPPHFHWDQSPVNIGCTIWTHTEMRLDEIWIGIRKTQTHFTIWHPFIQQARTHGKDSCSLKEPSHLPRPTFFQLRHWMQTITRAYHNPDGTCQLFRPWTNTPTSAVSFYDFGTNSNLIRTLFACARKRYPIINLLSVQKLVCKGMTNTVTRKQNNKCCVFHNADNSCQQSSILQ